MRIDHRNGTLAFGGQQLEAERIRGHLSTLARGLNKALTMIHPPSAPDRDTKRAAAMQVRERGLGGPQPPAKCETNPCPA